MAVTLEIENAHNFYNNIKKDLNISLSEQDQLEAQTHLSNLQQLQKDTQNRLKKTQALSKLFAGKTKFPEEIATTKNLLEIIQKLITWYEDIISGKPPYEINFEGADSILYTNPAGQPSDAINFKNSR